jgi:hypothetical protein
MTTTRERIEIYVSLPNEGVDVWRPVMAEQISPRVYRILEQPYDRSIERWEFEPGEIVVCELQGLSDGEVFVAKERAS